MRHTKRHIAIFILFPLVAVCIGIGIMLWSVYAKQPYKAEPIMGATFSTKYCKELGLDWKKVYIALLDDMEIRVLRIPIYWDEIEKKQGQVNLDDVRWMLDEAQKRGARVTPAVGRRVPRWPECHPPKWTRYLFEDEIQDAELAMIRTVTTELKDHPAIMRWQVQNEPLFGVFGECPEPDPEFVAESVDLVREIDPARDIIITDSGELSTWTETAQLADILGISMYRVTWNSFWGYFYYPVPPTMYTAKAGVIAPLVKDTIVSELQVEPWVPSSILTATLEEQYRSMDSERLLSNVDYVRRTGFSEVYLWGVEWWYWLKLKYDDPTMWETGKEVFSFNES
ncbi:MAG: hypothetical protein ABIG66_04975 [Candidatus Kerfeldbacteria bacterium]